MKNIYSDCLYNKSSQYLMTGIKFTDRKSNANITPKFTQACFLAHADWDYL